MKCKKILLSLAVIGVLSVGSAISFSPADSDDVTQMKSTVISAAQAHHHGHWRDDCRLYDDRWDDDDHWDDDDDRWDDDDDDRWDDDDDDRWENHRHRGHRGPNCPYYDPDDCPYRS